MILDFPTNVGSLISPTAVPPGRGASRCNTPARRRVISMRWMTLASPGDSFLSALRTEKRRSREV
jgi:hypothetical protein